MPVIGYLAPGPAEAVPAGSGRSGLYRGQKPAIEYRCTDFRAALMTEAAGDLVRLNMNVIFAAGPEAVALVRNATTSIPIVAVDFESDPVAEGYVKSLARPGGNMTRMFLDIPELSGKQAELLKEIIPRLSRMAIFGIPSLNAPQFATTATVVRALTKGPVLRGAAAVLAQTGSAER